MKYNEWIPYYKEIVSAFHFSESLDRKSSLILSEILDKKFLTENDLYKIIKGKEVLIIGDSPYFSLSESLIKNRLVVAADDATRHTLKMGITPDIVISDLDADIELLIDAANRGSIMGIHAHGDNINKLKIVEKFEKRFGTTQTEPLWNVYNFGGFTDGDRAAFISYHFNAKKIILTGFNFYEPNPHKGKDLKRKMKKLYFSKLLINLLINKYKANIVIL